MDTIAPEAFLEGFPPAIAVIGDRLRSLVLRAVPDASERVRPGWQLIGYDAPQDLPSADVPAPATRPARRRLRQAYFAYIAPEQHHIHLGFEYGWAMRDPDRRLEGAGITRQVRWLTFVPGDDPPPAIVVPLLVEARRVALLPRGERLEAALFAGVAGVPD
jgi:Domain of unknown function (DU1801)